ncbi:uncharacterized protein IL334_003091 [Kwoniella shivajii]|uniref:Zn(2)-C6 fungal-type domain-containing protein n=1 Tax=Kwoniella shivajii TaxID=564305 RepID=A0ABZ1CWK4_9TREE|nr:hypothetical protein IL334_003091 [Kwoniella shivajii]
MTRSYHPVYDSVLGRMGNSPPPTENTFQDDPSFLSQLDPSRLNEANTEAALQNLFGEAVASASNQNDHGDDLNMGNENDHTPTLASHQDIQAQDQNVHHDHGQTETQASTIESLPIPTPPPANVNQNHKQLDPSLIDPDLVDTENENENGNSPKIASSTGTKRKATSRANMLARGAACEFCKKRKLKCSAEVPTCTNCYKVGKECVYSQKKQRSRVRVLEDRLQELEKRLDQNNNSPSNINTGDRSDLPDNDMNSGVQGQQQQDQHAENGEDNISNSMYDNEFSALSSFDLGFGLTSTTSDKAEPDLMTLADAAAADTSVETDSWEGLPPDIVVAEILKAVMGSNNEKSVGEKIVSHLIQLYVAGPSIPNLHDAISPSTLLSRLANKTDKPVHPTLLFSLLPFLIPLSPSPTLQDPSITSRLITHARAQHAQAITNPDHRILDLVAASTLRAYQSYTQAKYFEGWTETSSATGMTYASGLSKLGHVGERFVVNREIHGRKERLEKEKKLRLVLTKGMVVPPPQDKAELGERIRLFWFAYMNDRGGSIGWGWPSSFNDDEITTPWPKDEYETDESMLDNRTITDFMNSTVPDDASKDSILASHCKAMTLFYHAKRLFDTSPSISTPDRTLRLLRLTKGYMATLPPMQHTTASEIAISQGPRNQVSISLYATLCILHAKEEIDSPPGAGKEYFDKSIVAAGKMLDIVDITQSNGDVELLGLDISSAVLFHLVGRLMTKYAERISLSPLEYENGNDGLISDLNSKKESFSKALFTLGKKQRFANVASQLLYNISLGSEFKSGEYERPDNMP